MSGKILDRFKRPLRDLRLSVMDRCNFRCPYCMPEDAYPEGFPFLSPQERLSFDHMMDVARVAVDLGVHKVRITGGEPLLRTDLPELISRLRALDGLEDIAVTTNGYLLRRQIKALKKAGLTRVSVSLDALDPDIFLRMSGGKGDVATVLDGIESAREADLSGDIKVNMVVKKGENDSEVVKIAEYFRHKNVSVRFIEYMDVGNCNGWERSQVVPSAELFERINALWPLEPRDPLVRGEVASRFKYKDGAGEIGFISSVTAPFCKDCSRLRLSSDGKLYTCLFAGTGHDLRPILNGDMDVEEKRALLTREISDVWHARSDRYSEDRTNFTGSAKNKNVRITRKSGKRIEMNYIGG